MMRGKFTLVNLIVSYVLHVADVGLDIYVAIQYSIRGERWWFSLTLAFIVLPVIITNFISFSPLRSLLTVSICFRDAIRKWKDENWDNPPCERNDWRCSCEVCKIFCEKRKISVESIRNLAGTRYVETIAESAPQWCLQNYVMFRQWFFPWYTILSTIFSFLSLAWSIAKFEKAEKLYNWYINEEKLRNYPSSPFYVTFFSWQLCGLLSRLTALVVFAYAFRYYVFVVFGVHWLVLVLVSCSVKKKDGMDEHRHWIENLGFLGYCTCVSYPIMFHISGNASKLVFGEDFEYREKAIFLCHVLLSLENIILVSLAVWVAPARATHMDDLKTIVLFAVFVGLLAASTFMILYYRYHHPGELAQGQQDNKDEEMQGQVKLIHTMPYDGSDYSGSEKSEPVQTKKVTLLSYHRSDHLRNGNAVYV